MNEFVSARLLPEQQEVFAIVRELMREGAPGASEVISRGSPAWKGEGLLAIVSPSKTHLTLAFVRGAEFTDGHGLLSGVGKTTRHVKLKRADAVDRDALRDYIGQAVTLDAG
ncbi:DUF1801 domain-containing protein [Sphaerisporangium dianthi]|uniref:DUF1801 domain-containing protein n=1 Tax=Sphaerisporangium dianthi TaxID=1436120 RepID=UPI0036D360FD